MKSSVTWLLLAWVSFLESPFLKVLFGTTPLESHLEGLPDLYEASISELQLGLEKRQFTSVDLVKVHNHL